MQNLIKFHRFTYNILSGNGILTITKGHYCVVNLRKGICNNPKLGLVMVNAYAKFDHSIDSFTISSGNQILTIIKGHNCVVNLRKWTPNNPNLDPINVIEYAKIGLILLLRSQHIERKRTRNDGNTESRTT